MVGLGTAPSGVPGMLMGGLGTISGGFGIGVKLGGPGTSPIGLGGGFEMGKTGGR